MFIEQCECLLNRLCQLGDWIVTIASEPYCSVFRSQRLCDLPLWLPGAYLLICLQLRLLVALTWGRWFIITSKASPLSRRSEYHGALGLCTENPQKFWIFFPIVQSWSPGTRLLSVPPSPKLGSSVLFSSQIELQFVALNSVCPGPSWGAYV